MCARRSGATQKTAARALKKLKARTSEEIEARIQRIHDKWKARALKERGTRRNAWVSALARVPSIVAPCREA